MNKRIFILVFIFATISVFSQKFQKAVIETIDGSTKTGLINGKIEKQASKIKFKSNDNAKTETISIDLIKSINLQDSSGENYLVENVPVYMNEKRSKSESILMIKKEFGYYDLYFLADISFDKNGIMQFSDMQYQAAEVPSVYYFIKKKKEKYGDFFASENINGKSGFSPYNKYLKKNMERLMSDDKNLIIKVENKNLSVKDIPQIVREYNDFKKVNGTE